MKETWKAKHEEKRAEKLAGQKVELIPSSQRFAK